MKKTVFTLMLLAMCLSISACGSNGNTDTTETAQETEVASTEPAETKEVIEETVQPTELEEEEVPEETEAAEEENELYVALNETLEADNFVMSFESFEIVPELEIPAGENSWLSPSIDEGYQMAVIKGNFENNSSSTVERYAFYLTFVANGEYSYDDVSFYFEGSNNSEIASLASKTFYIYVQLPDKLIEMYETGTLTIEYQNDLSNVWMYTTSFDNSYTLTCTLDTAGAENESGEESEAVAETVVETEVAETTALNIGDTIVTDRYEFTLNKVELTYEVKPDTTSSYYNSYKADSGKVYINIDGYYYNTSKQDVCIRDLPVATADYDDGYTYDGFAVAEDGNQFDWTNSKIVCTPLETCHYHCLIECPEIVDQSDAALYILLPLADGVTYRYDIR